MSRCIGSRVALAVVVLAEISTASANAQTDCVRIGGVAEVRPGGEVRREKGTATQVKVSMADGTVAAASKDVLRIGSLLTVPMRRIVQILVGCPEQQGRLTVTPTVVAKDGKPVTLPSRAGPADTLSDGLYSLPVDSSNPSLRAIAMPGSGSLLVEWFKGPMEILLQRVGIRLRVTHTRFLIIVPPDGRDAYVLLESGSIEVVGASITLTAGKLWRIRGGAPGAIPRVEEAPSDPTTLERLSDAARFDEGIASPPKSFFQKPAGLATVGAIAAVGAVVVWQLISHDCGSDCNVGVSVPIP